jgi:putative CocE/NonD family hydrolase
MRRALRFLPLLLLVASAAAQVDQGTYDMTLNGEPMGQVAFKAFEGGAFETQTSMKVGEIEAETKLTLRCKDGLPTAIDYVVTKPEEVTVEYRFEGLKGTVKARGQESEVELPEKGAIFENANPYIAKNILDTYDLAKMGKQELKAFDVGSTKTYSFVTELVETPERKLGDRVIPTRVWKFHVVLVDSTVITDTSNKPLLWVVKAQNFDAVLRGYEGLREKEPEDPLLSKPAYEVTTEKDAWIVMRDGVRLQADIYRPDAEGKFPIVLSRSAYGRAQGFVDGPFYARRGYAYVMQDVRGRGGSEGDWEPAVNEALDGYDTVEWCATQPWSLGAIGMTGGSYGGWVQWMAASQAPKGLKALVPLVSPPDPYFNFPYDHGAFMLAGSLWWAGVVREKDANLAETADLGPALNVLPLSQVDDKYFGENIPFFDKWLEHDTYDDYWKAISFHSKMDRIDLPVLHVSGWYDGDGIGTKLNYAAMMERGRKNQKLIFGPWPHALNISTTLAELDFGPTAIIDLQKTTLRWFDHWLKGVENGIDKEPPVSLFVMGENRWEQADRWPPKNAEPQKWYLHSTGPANSDNGLGFLSTETPDDEEPDRYTYNPLKEKVDEEIKVDVSQMTSGSLDIADECDEQDVLVYDSEVLEEPVTVLGPVSGRLYAATSAKDTDWVMILADVHPDGKVIYLCTGQMRAKFRDSWSEPKLLKPGEVHAYDLDLWSTGIRFDKGHKIRVMVASTMFPRFDRNLNTGEPIANATRAVAANQTIYHDRSHASYILLPVVKED